MVFALIGNQNCGKSTLFNKLTGANQHIGNFPGVTVDQKSGVIKGTKDVIVDLPGIYSLSPYTSEEVVTRDFLIKGNPNCILNIVDANNIERNLYLSLQLMDINKPMVIALNMMDEVRANGGSIDVKTLEKRLGVRIVCISAAKNEGLEELVETMLEVAKSNQKPQNRDFCTGAVHRAIHSIAIMIEDHAENVGIDSRFVATKLIEGDKPILDLIDISQNEIEGIEHAVVEMEREIDSDREAILADMRYDYIDKICSNAVVKHGESKEAIRSKKIDRLLTHRYLAIPIFVVIMALVFFLTFGLIGNNLSKLLAYGIDCLADVVDGALTTYGLNPVVQSLVVDGVFAGLGSVLAFLPTVMVLFLFLSLLEDSGYMARVAFFMDRGMRKIGLTGRSFVPMIVGFGCSVPAIMSTRTLASDRDRRMTIFLVPFMSCSAKLPIYAVFVATFFPNTQVLAMISLYLGGIVVGIISGFMFNKFTFKGQSVSFIMELPNYRMPTLKNVILMMWEKAKDFLQRAFTVIFIATIVIWFLQSFDAKLNFIQDSTNSVLASIGQFISPIFTPLGFGDWRASTSLITGFTAKESVVSTLAVLTNSSTGTLSNALTTMFTPLSSASFLAFVLLYTPCIATIRIARTELHSRIGALSIIIYQTAVAWVVAFLIFNIGSAIIH